MKRSQQNHTETAAHLIDHVLPLAPYRQMVLSFPRPLRYWMHTNKNLFSKIHSIIIKEMHRYYINKAKIQGIKDPRPGSISFTQLARSALNLNPHLHVLVIDGVYTEVNGVVASAGFAEEEAAIGLVLASMACYRRCHNPYFDAGPQCSRSLRVH